MVRRFDSPQRKVFYIESGADLDQVLKAFLESNSTEIEGKVEETKFNIDRESVESMKSVGINALKEITGGIKKGQNESKSIQE